MKRSTSNRADWLDVHFGKDKSKPHRKKNRPAMKMKAKRIHKSKYGVK